MNAEYKLSLTNRSIEDAELGAKDMLINTRDAMGFIPNMYDACSVCFKCGNSRSICITQ